MSNFYDSIFKSAVDAIIVINNVGIIEAFSPSAEKLFGYAENIVVGKNISILMPKKIAMEHDGYLENYRKTSNAKIIGIGREVVGKKSNGQEFNMHLSVGKAEDESGNLKYIGICHDMTPYYSVKNDLNETMENYDNLSNYEGLYIASIDKNGLVIKSNVLFSESGFFDSNKFVMDFFENYKFEHIIQKTLQDGFYSISKSSIEIDEKKHVIDWNFKLASNDRIQIVGIDRTESEKISESLLKAKMYDPITELPNVNYLRFLLESKGVNLDDYYFFRARFEMVEVNKKIFDRDFLTKSIYTIFNLIESVECVDYTIQISDYSFLSCVKKTYLPIPSLFNEIVKNISDLALSTDFIVNKKFRVGFCDYHDNGIGKSIDEILRRTDFSLRYAINNNVVVSYYDASVEDSINRIKYIESNVIKVMDDEVVLYFQPKIKSEDFSVYGYEALMRWNSKLIGWVSPVEIISAVNNLDLMELVDKEIIIKAFKAISENPLLQKMSISINMSSISINSCFIVGLIEESAKAFDIDLDYIDIEITEDSLIDDSGNARSNIDLLRSKGVSFSLDDFGKGYSSLSYLTSFNINYLKIDKLFIDALGTYRGDGMVESIIKIAHLNGMKVVAEGVENNQQVVILKEMKCDFFQGYYFGKPTDISNLRG